MRLVLPPLCIGLFFLMDGVDGWYHMRSPQQKMMMMRHDVSDDTSSEATRYMRTLDLLNKKKKKRSPYLDILENTNRPQRHWDRRSVWMRKIEDNIGRNTTRRAWTIMVESEDVAADDPPLFIDNAQTMPDDDLDPSELRKEVMRRVAKHTQKKQSSTGGFHIEDTFHYNFSSIGGYEAIKTELMQIIDFMVHPEKYEPYNVRLPRGLLLHGEPGTGKTLFAKCLAGECGLPFIPTSGSEFQEKYVGVGASRVRELFQFAREHKPCIIFLDEVDGVARRRGADSETAQAERDSTLNQLLVEMDGFHENRGIMILASTNRDDILDPAILRPGRFDKKIHIHLPNFETRLRIIDIHKQSKPIEVETAHIARLTAGWSGAQIENLLNEVSLYGIREDILPINETVLNDYHEAHRLGGASLTPLNFSTGSLWRIAVHEMGHVLLAFHADHHEKPIRCSVASPNGRMAGFTAFGNSPSSGEDDNMLMTKEYMMDRLRILLGGRVAEELIFGTSVSSGARQDLDMCQELARRMVLDFGMGKRIIYSSMSDENRRRIDEDIEHKIEVAYQEARSILERNTGLLRFMAQNLFDKRTLDRDDMTTLILQGKTDPPIAS